MQDQTKLVSEIYSIIQNNLEDKSVNIKSDTPLVGSSNIDSMKLVELCLSLEEKATEYEFQFDWTSSSAMSKSRGIFRTAGSLTDEFLRQMKLQK